MKIRPARGKRIAGWLDFYFRPGVAQRRKPFNDQRFRQRIFAWIVAHVRPTYLVETGTHRGSTTEYMARHAGVAVHTIDVDERNLTFARLRLRAFPDVILHLGDSQILLQRLLDERLLPDGIGFYYLDAHWGEELPLAREIDLILERRPESLLMIDDFQVPDDAGYGYDDYGAGKTLTVDYVEPSVRRLGLRAFFPDCSSTEETGAQRGTLVLARDSAALLAGCTLLREWQFP